MAGEWIKVRNDLDKDPHVLRLIEILDFPDPDLVIGKLIRIWIYADLYTVSGKILYGSPEVIDRISGQMGLGKALEAVGWITYHRGPPNFAQIVRFKEHNGKSAKRRMLAARRMERSRRKIQDDDAQVLRWQRNTCAPREEKRRIDQRRSRIPPTPQGGRQAAPDPQFSTFWEKYPRKVAKAAAVKAWGKLRPDADLFITIMAGLQRQAGCEQWSRDGGRFIPHPASWINQCRWEDEPAASAPPRAAETAEQRYQRVADAARAKP